MSTIWLVGAGPGAVDLITVRGRSLLARAGAILYAGSLVSPEHLQFARSDCRIADSSGMTLEIMIDWLLEQAKQTDEIVRLQTGDPSLYGTLAEMAQPLLAAGLTIRVVPGVPAFAAAAATALETLTQPETTQTVILTRVEGRTGMPVGEKLRDLAQHGATLCIHLSITLWPRIREELAAAGWPDDAPILVVYKASWVGEEQILRGSLAEIADICRAAGVQSQAMIILGPTLGACRGQLPHGGTARMPRSQLYHPAFGHGFRAAVTLPDPIPKERGRDVNRKKSASEPSLDEVDHA